MFGRSGWVSVSCVCDRCVSGRGVLKSFHDHLRWLKARSKQRDRTEYTGWAADTRKTSRPFMEHWMQRISTATVRGNARRALNALSALAFRFS